MPSLPLRTLFVLFPLVAALFLSGCSEDRSRTTLDVTLKEWSVEPSVSSAPAGDITFDLQNDGSSHDHELLIIRTDFAPDGLPTKADGTVDEGAAGVSVIGKIRKFEKGKKSSGTYTLEAGKYVLICNLHDEANGEKVSHYQQGMRVAFTAE